MKKTFTIPALPPSLNMAYKVNWLKRRIYLHVSAVDFKNKAVAYIPPMDIAEKEKLKVSVEYHGQFLNKGNGKTKRKDGQNLDKVLYDIIFEVIGVDDSNVWEGRWEKIHNPKKEFTTVTIQNIK